MNTSIHTLDRVSKTLLEHILAEIDVPLDQTCLITGMGLPETTIDVMPTSLAIAVTPIQVPFFRDQMMEVVHITGRDLIVIRAGFHPETLNPLEFDAVASTLSGPVPLFDLSLFRGFDGSLHLVPARGGLCLAFEPRRVQILTREPFSSPEERRHGREKAAAEIVRKLR